ncbi:class I SAM-dependent methyltransferase [Streptomycetaceae bacterium NBC_01309]
MAVDDLARRGFGSGADRYHRARPSYRPEVMAYLGDALGLGPGVRVLDLAAGTGHMTVRLVELGAHVSAVEPSEAMRAVCAETVPGVAVVAGTAEDIPFAAESFDAVVVAQAFHWFDGPAALREIARVLRPGGGLALLWNERDGATAFDVAVGKALAWSKPLPYDVRHDFTADLDASGHFGAARARQFPWAERLSHEQQLARVSTISYINAMPPDARRDVLDRLRGLLADQPDPRDVGHVTNTFVATKPGT